MEKLQLILTILKINLPEIAAKANCSRVFVSYVLAGKRNCNPAVREAIVTTIAQKIIEDLEG